MSLLEEYEDFVDKAVMLAELCQKISMCDADAVGDFELSDFLVDPSAIRTHSFQGGFVPTVKQSVGLREAYDAAMSMDRLDTFVNMDRSFFYEVYAPIEYEVYKKTLDFQRGVLRDLI